MRYGSRFPDTILNLLFFRREKADIYHITGHVHYIALLFPPENTVLSIMDLRFLATAGTLRRFLLRKLYLDLPVRRLNYITAISEQTRQEILEQTGCDPQKVRTLGLPLFAGIEAGNLKQFNSNIPAILQVGTMENKNIPMLARALGGVRCTLRIIGKLSEEQVSALAENKVNYTHASGLSDEQIRQEYENADIVAFCSTYEGFGLPIIEAQSMQKPVITSRLSPMIETSGEAAFLADPLDPLSIREGILKIVNDAAYREKIVAAGLTNIERFAPQNIAKQYEDLYDEILAVSTKHAT